MAGNIGGPARAVRRHRRRRAGRREPALALPGRSSGSSRVRCDRRSHCRSLQEGAQQQALSLVCHRRRGRGTRVLLQARQPDQQLVLYDARARAPGSYGPRAPPRHPAGSGHNPPSRFLESRRRRLRAGRVPGRQGHAVSRHSRRRDGNQFQFESDLPRYALCPGAQAAQQGRALRVRSQLRPHTARQLPGGPQAAFATGSSPAMAPAASLRSTSFSAAA